MTILPHKYRKSYSQPKIELIELDNEISLILSSYIAPGDPEALMMQTDLLINDPIMTDVMIGL